MNPEPAFAAGTAIEDMVDTALLAEWMEQQRLDRGPILGIKPLNGGTQNIILRFTKGGRHFVMRRPPLSQRAESNETMRRESRILAALAETDVPHPRLIAACVDEARFGYAFYLMEPVEGFNAVSGLPVSLWDNPEARHAMGLSIVEGAVKLGAVDYKAVGLEGFGKPDGYLERQVTRWRSQLEGYSRHNGWPGIAALPGIEAVRDYLDANRPTDFEPGILHGDYSIGNVMFRNDRPELAAIIDWELTTIGDPLLDLGWLLATWHGEPPVNLPVLTVDPWDGFPTGEELVAHYASLSHRNLNSINWYAVLACYKLAIILEGTFARACAGRDPMATGRQLHDTATKLLQRALHRIQ